MGAPPRLHPGSWNQLLAPLLLDERPTYGYRRDRTELRWTSDSFEIPCPNVKISGGAFSLDTCHPEFTAHRASPTGIGGEMIRVTGCTITIVSMLVPYSPSHPDS